MQYRIVHQYDLTGFYVGEGQAWESPLEPGVYLLPAGSVETAPPDIAEGERARWTGAAWEVVPPEPPPLPDAELPRTAAELVTWAGYQRRVAEAAGVSMEGVIYASDVESQARITATLAYLERSGTPTARWKSWGGWFDLTPAQLVALGLLVGAHTQHCFDAEEAVLAAIAAGDLTTYAQVEAAFAAQMEG